MPTLHRPEHVRILAAMHAYRRFVESEMDKRGWTAADLQRSSGLTKQNLSRLLNDSREQLQQRPEPATVTALARGFGVSEPVVLSYVAEAMGLPVSRVTVSDPAALSNEELLRVLAERLARGDAHDQLANTPDSPRPRRAGADDVPVEGDAQPDGVTTRADGERDARPWEENEYSLAAKRGLNRGRAAREQQDRSAEEGGA